MEINPNSKMPTQLADRDIWQKLTTLLMLKLGVREVNITVEYIDQLCGAGVPCIVVHGHERSITLKLFDHENAAMAYMAEQQPKG